VSENVRNNWVVADPAPLDRHPDVSAIAADESGDVGETSVVTASESDTEAESSVVASASEEEADEFDD